LAEVSRGRCFCRLLAIRTADGKALVSSSASPASRYPTRSAQISRLPSAAETSEQVISVCSTRLSGLPSFPWYPQPPLGSCVATSHEATDPTALPLTGIPF